ncbi:MAG: hypothetical protein ACRD1X_17950 [Vicinamibacteria bacterium]
MANYFFRFTDTIDNTLAAGGIAQDATTQRRAYLVGLTFRLTALPITDQQIELAVTRGTTALGTSTPVTPAAVDPGDVVASTVDPQENYTVNPTLGSQVGGKGGNVRQDIQLVIKTGKEIILAATANLSLLFRPIVGPANTCSGGCEYDER